jgi:hypothetical protein
MFLAQREASKGTGMPGTEYPTAKDDLDLNLIQLIKARQGGGGETKEAEPDEIVPAYDEPAYDDEAAAAAQAQQEAEEAAAAAAQAEQLAAKAAMAEQAADEAAVAEAAVANTNAGDDFGDDW